VTPQEIEAATALGWPAHGETNIAGWRVFAGLGPVGRVNSCWPLAYHGDGVGQAISDVEAHYRSKGLAPQFKLIVDGAQPPDLRERLARGGYRRVSHVAVMVLDEPMSAPIHQVAISPRVTQAFADVVTQTSPSAIDGQERNDILARVPNPSAFGSIAIDGEFVCVGLATFTGASAGIAAMRTKPEHRQRGYARSVLRAVSVAASDAGACVLWLQVETENVPAMRLYESEGFTVSYHYETLRLGP
jgi:N-acetylglutamate synthase